MGNWLILERVYLHVHAIVVYGARNYAIIYSYFNEGAKTVKYERARDDGLLFYLGRRTQGTTFVASELACVEDGDFTFYFPPSNLTPRDRLQVI